MSMTFESIRYEVADGIARLTMSRPEKLNAISDRMMQEMHDALWEADDNKDVHCVVLSGEGRAFCAGYDFSGLEIDSGDPVNRRGYRSFDDFTWQMERSQRLRMALFDMHKPVIAQVHGYCLAGGTDIATLSDIVICADDARFGFPPGRNLGVLPTQMWLYHVGPQWAKRLLLTGDTVDGVEAAQIGLALKSVPADMLPAETDGLARRLALVDPVLLAANKRVVNLGLEMMGARTMQRLAAELDARGHLADSAIAFQRSAVELGLREAIRRRDAPFGDGRARVSGPEIRDGEGNLVPLHDH